VTDQPALFGVSIPPGLRLGPNQHLVLEMLAERPCSSEELGAAIHARRHDQPEHFCDFCAGEGASVASSLRSHRLVKHARKLGVWYLVEKGRPNERPKRTSSAQTDVIPF
jgi:hypothetical protein